MTSSEQQIAVKGQAPVTLTLRRSPHGPIINDVLGENGGKTPICHVVGVPRHPEPDP